MEFATAIGGQDRKEDSVGSKVSSRQDSLSSITTNDVAPRSLAES